MADIKTKEMIKGTIKTIDRTAIASDKIKHAYIETKDKAEHSISSNETSPEEYAANNAERHIDSSSKTLAYNANKIGYRSFKETKENISKLKNDPISAKESFKTNRLIKSFRKQKDDIQKDIKQSVASSGTKDIKVANKIAKVNDNSIKVSNKTIKTPKDNTAVINKAKKSSQILAQKAKVAIENSRKAARTLISYIKMIIASLKSLIVALIAGGWLTTMIIIVIMLVALITCSVFGIFFSGEDSGNGMTMKTVVQEINKEYEEKLEEEKNSIEYDILEMRGSRAVWKDVLAIYSIKVNTDNDNPQEVATMNEEKKEILKDIFWQMNEITSETETKTEIVITETDDGKGNIVEEETEVTQTYLYITVSHKTVYEMIAEYNFNNEQQKLLAELLDERNNSLWSQVLYGIGTSDGQIVDVALSQVGNVGGQPYWSWYGFNSRVEWCACFVSWCANECGYIEAGVIPKFASVVLGIDWFKTRGQWADNSIEPSPGSIIFFDWEQDGLSDHVGIVEKCENGIVYTVEGNSIGDSCRQKEYFVGSSYIYGYGLLVY